MTLLTVKEVAKELKLHPVTVRRYIREGKIVASLFGRVWRVQEQALDEFLERTKRDKSGRRLER